MPDELLTPRDLLLRVGASNKARIKQVGRVRFFAGERATVLVSGRTGDVHQLCQIQFKDAHIFVHFPYLGDRPGLLREIKRGDVEVRTIDMTDGGKLVSTHVKYAHKHDGRTHFSQDGKARTTVIRQSFRLDGPIGTIFQLYAFRPAGFEPITKLKKDRVYLPFVFEDGLPDAIYLYADWMRISGIEQNINHPRGIAGPITTVIDRRSGLSTPRGFYGAQNPDATHMLVVTCLPTALPTGLSDSGMVLRAGFDNHELPPDHPDRGKLLPTGWLSFLYPVSLSETVRERVESIDYHPPKTG